MRTERAVEDVRDLEVGRHRERVGTQVLGLVEALDREGADVRGGRGRVRRLEARGDRVEVEGDRKRREVPLTRAGRARRRGVASERSRAS